MAERTLILLILQNIVPSYHTYLPGLLAVKGGSISVTPLWQLGSPPFLLNTRAKASPCCYHSSGPNAGNSTGSQRAHTAACTTPPHSPGLPLEKVSPEFSCMLKLLRVKAQQLPPGFRHTDLFSLLPLNVVHQNVSMQLLPFCIPHLNFDYSESN